MTKEEYQKYLDSDYWKGYSYSIIKERNFTCADCGRSFPNERNKLQVHHLVYRDIAPWSYKPEELIVLCRECHEKRHGIYRHQEQPQQGSYQTVNRGGYEKEPSDNRMWRWAAIAIVCLLIYGYWPNIRPLFNLSTKNPKAQEMVTEKSRNSEMRIGQDEEVVIKEVPKEKKKEKTKTIATPPITISSDNSVESVDPIAETTSSVKAEDHFAAKPVSTNEARTHSDRQFWEDRAKDEGLSTEGSISDIQKRLDRKFWEDRARAEGLSTEGSISDIQKRLDRKFWEDRAKGK